MNSLNKPYSQACEQNYPYILQAIKTWLDQAKTVLEIGSGTGQHAVKFAKDLPHLIWQTSDVKDNHDGINQWIISANLDNLLTPVEMQIPDKIPPIIKYDLIFSANNLHIMSLSEAEYFFKVSSQRLKPNGNLIVYGPFNYNGDYTSESNARFDVWLKNNCSTSCIKDFEEVCKWGNNQQLELTNDIPMPANNRILIWQKK